MGRRTLRLQRGTAIAVSLLMSATTLRPVLSPVTKALGFLSILALLVVSNLLLLARVAKGPILPARLAPVLVGFLSLWGFYLVGTLRTGTVRSWTIMLELVLLTGFFVVSVLVNWNKLLIQAVATFYLVFLVLTALLPQMSYLGWMLSCLRLA